ncbi:MAG: aldehyde dehydrogenase family protein [Calditrichaeota bacterium]|nr:aldehyde dehydrogenase family protein [Calditrichota bacterium]
MATPTYLPFIHNEWVKTYKSITIKNPYSQKKIARVYLTEGDFLDMAVESSLIGFKYSRQLSGYDRYELLMGIVHGLEKREKEIIRTITEESGKPIRFARNEVDRAKLTFTWAAEEARRLNGEYIPLDVAPQTRGYFGISRRFPLGVVMGISPFNFPLNLVAHKLAPALATGNSIILKPASQTPVTALKLGEIIKETGIPPGMVNIIPASGKTAEILVKDGRIKKLTFTGSASVGWYLRSVAGKKPVTLELGGNAAVIVEPDTDLDEIIPRLVTGSFAYAGQVCISVQRIYVQEDIFESFIDNFTRETRKNAITGDPSREETMVGPMIDNDSAKTAEDWVKEAIKGGATLIMGGHRNKNFLEPTILTGTSPHMKAVCEEIFAPVVSIESYRNFTDAINMVNNSHYGLQAGIYCNDFKKIQQAYNELDVGGVIVNDYPTFRIDPMPYGGMKDSGSGREGLRYAMEEMTEIKLLAVRGYKNPDK